MDTIEIRVESCNGVAVAGPWAAVFGAAGGTIGRGGQNRLVLPDTDALIDRVHAMVRLQAGQAYITNLCERRSIRIGDEELAPGQEATLPLAASLQIGPYTLRAAPPAPGAPPPPAQAAAGAAPLIPDDFDPFAPDAARARSERDPWADGLPMQDLAGMATVPDDLLRGLPTAQRIDQPTLMDKRAVRGLPASLESRAEVDPLRLFGAQAAPAPLAEDAARLLRGSELGQAVRLPQEAAFAPVPAPLHAAAPPAVCATPPHSPAAPQADLQRIDGLDLGMFDRPPAARATEPPAAAEATIFAGFDAELAPTLLQPLRVPVPPPPAAAAPLLDFELDLAHAGARQSVDPGATSVKTPAPPSAPPPAPTPAPPPPPASTPTPPATVADVQALTQAFLLGLGLPSGQAPVDLTPEVMQRLGQVLRAAVQGTMDLLQTRAALKREFRADVTIMDHRINNPLKFLPDAEGVLLQVLGPPRPGFMPLVPAINEACRDLRVHQTALLAGMRAAIEETLAELDPAALEQQPSPGGGLLARLTLGPGKAALWDAYRQRHADIRRRTQGDLAALAGRSFAKAYDAAAEAARDNPASLPRRTP